MPTNCGFSRLVEFLLAWSQNNPTHPPIPEEKMKLKVMLLVCVGSQEQGQHRGLLVGNKKQQKGF